MLYSDLVLVLEVLLRIIKTGSTEEIMEKAKKLVNKILDNLDRNIR